MRPDARGLHPPRGLRAGPRTAWRLLAPGVVALLFLMMVPVGAAEPPQRHATTGLVDASGRPTVLYAQFGLDPDGGEAYLAPQVALDRAYTAGFPLGEGRLALKVLYPLHAALAEGEGRYFPDYRMQARWGVPFLEGEPVVAQWHLSVPPMEAASRSVHPLWTLRTELVAHREGGVSEVLAAGESSLPLDLQRRQALVVDTDLGVPSRAVAVGEWLTVDLSWVSALPSTWVAEPGLPGVVEASGAGGVGLTVLPRSRVVLPMEGTIRVDAVGARSVLDEILVRGTVRHAFNLAFVDLPGVSLAANGPAVRSLVASPMLWYERDAAGVGVRGVVFEWRLPYAGPSPEGAYEFTVMAPGHDGQMGAGSVRYDHGQTVVGRVASMVPGAAWGAVALLGVAVGALAWRRQVRTED